MGRQSGFDKLPAAVRAEIDSRLIDNGFSQYVELAAELRQRGHKMSPSALHRHGQAMERRLELDRTAEELMTLGIGAELTAELSGTATLVVVIDRRNSRARLISVPTTATAVIAAIKKIGAGA